MPLITVIFQKQDCAGRPAGLLTTWNDGEIYQPSHYCLVVEVELFTGLKYDKVPSGVDPDTGEEQFSLVDKGVTYLLDIGRLKEEYPECETNLIYTDNISLVKELPRG